MKIMEEAAKIVSAVAVAIFLVTAGLVGMVETKVTVEIKFRRFANPSGRDESGSYCDGVSSSCETYFKLCVKLSRTITTLFSGCDYQSTSLRYIRSNNIDFQTQNTNINKTILLKRKQWSGNVSFYMEVWDDDTLRDDKIDTFRYTHFYPPGINGSAVEHFLTLYGARSSYKTTLYFSIKIFCDLHYYGSNCSRFCKSSDDTSGHYRCTHTGERVCYQNWYNLPNCSKHCASQNDDINGHYVCTSNGSRVCQQNWYNLPYCKTYCMPQNDTVSGHYECSNTGIKICHDGWYDENCTTFCLPQTSDHYNCSVMGARICHRYWYGPNCTRFCNSSSDILNGFYNCSSAGIKLCGADYFGENCTVLCKEIQNGKKQYICDKRTGDKLCLEKWTGPFCNVSRIMSLSTRMTQRLTLLSVLTSGFPALTTTSSDELLPFSKVVTVASRSIRSTVHIWTQGARTLTVRMPSSAALFSRPLRSTSALSMQQSASFTSVHNNKHQASFTGSLQATSPAAQSSEKEIRVSMTVSTTSTTITTGSLAPSKSSSVYSKLHSTVTRVVTTPKSEVAPEKENSGNKSKNVTWLLDTKKGRTVLVGVIFACLLLLGVVILIVIYLRLPRKDTPKDFENLNDTPDEWKTDEQLARSYANPLYVPPHDSCQRTLKKKQSKLEKFYTKKYPSKESKNNEDLMGVSDTSYDGFDDQTGIYKNPLFGVKNQSYDAAKEETNV